MHKDKQLTGYQEVKRTLHKLTVHHTHIYVLQSIIPIENATSNALYSTLQLPTRHAKSTISEEHMNKATYNACIQYSNTQTRRATHVNKALSVKTHAQRCEVTSLLGSALISIASTRMYLTHWTMIFTCSSGCVMSSVGGNMLTTPTRSLSSWCDNSRALIFNACT